MRTRRRCNSGRWLLLLLLLLLVAGSGWGRAAEVRILAVPDAGGAIRFDYAMPRKLAADAPVLVVIPTHNEEGRAALEGGDWLDFADRNGLPVMAPTFTVTAAELRRGEGYYYPEQGSGAVLEQALAELARREQLKAGKVLLFGHSAGAHFAHRFALWRPQRVRAFVAYAAGWWSDPTPALRGVPALIMCGEDDPRYEATQAFMGQAVALGLPWIWRSYRNTGHEATPAVLRMARAFLAHYARPERGSSAPFYGDMQTFRYVPAAEKESIPETVRVCLPTRRLAEAWSREE